MARSSRLLIVAALLIASVVITVIVVLASPRGKMDLSGKWVLNVSKSDFGPVPGPKSRTDEITQKGTHFTLSRTQVSPADQSSTVKVDCIIDGGDCTIAFSSGDSQLRARAAWDGDVLAIASVLTTNGEEIKVRDVYSLSADRKVMTVRRHIAIPDAPAVDQTFVLDKQ